MAQGNGEEQVAREGPPEDGDRLLDLIRARRSVRAHTEELVPAEVLAQLLEAARWAPTGGNRQRWCFVVVQDPLRIRKLAAVSPGLLGKPTALIVICSETDNGADRSRELNEACSLIETGMAAQNIMLAATAWRLGSCPVRSFNAAAVGRLLKLPAGIQPELIVTLGHPARQVRAPARRPAEQLIHWEHFGGQKGQSDPEGQQP
jgi:albonoursin synthase